MNKIWKGNVPTAYPLKFERETDFTGYDVSYPIKKVLSSSYEGDIQKVGDALMLNVSYKAALSVYDSLDNVPFEYETKGAESLEIFEDEDGEKEGYVISGTSFDLDEVVLSLIVSSLPIRLVRKGSKVPLSADYEVLSEEEYLKKGGNSPLDEALDKLELELDE